MIKRHQRVRLASFNGTAAPLDPSPDGDNFWRLIGQSGTVVHEKNDRSRYLVRFDISVASQGLHSHNPIENTLWILESDLKVLT